MYSGEFDEYWLTGLLDVFAERVTSGIARYNIIDVWWLSNVFVYFHVVCSSVAMNIPVIIRQIRIFITSVGSPISVLMNLRVRHRPKILHSFHDAPLI